MEKDARLIVKFPLDSRENFWLYESVSVNNRHMFYIKQNRSTEG